MVTKQTFVYGGCQHCGILLIWLLGKSDNENNGMKKIRKDDCDIY